MARLGEVQHRARAGGRRGRRVIKTVLSMHHGVLPRTLHLDAPTSHVDWSAGSVELLTDSMPGRRRASRAGRGSPRSGLSGTNAHVILEQAPAMGEPPAAGAGVALPVVPWVLSGKSEGALRGQAERLLAHVTLHRDLSLRDVGFSLAASRAVFEHRARGRRRGPRRSWCAAWLRWLRVRRRRGSLLAVAGGLAWCSPGRARSGPGWAGSCMRRFRCSRLLSTRSCELDLRCGR